MELQYKPDFAVCKEYWAAFWQGEIIDRPLISVTAPKTGFTQPSTQDFYMMGSDGNYQQALEKFEAWAAATYFGGEAIPCFDISFGPDQFSAFLGAELVHSADHHTSWVKPFVDGWMGVDLRLDRKPGGIWSRMCDFHRVAAQYSDGKFLITLPDLHSNMDCLSAIRGPQNLCMDLIDFPDEVTRVLRQVRLVYPEVCETLLSVGDMNRRGTTSWINAYCEGWYNVIQCDFLAMLSPKLARDFVLPALEEEANFWDHTIFHLDGPAALVHLDDILSIPAIDVIQWVPGDGQPRTIEWMDLLHKIQGAGKGLWLYDWTPEEIKTRFKELRPERLWFSVQVGSEREADELMEWLRART
mgnify:CR=1 FL=1